MTARDPSPMQYRIRIRGHLDPAWIEWFAELAIDQKDDGTTELVGQFSDQSALYGLLARLRDLGATLLMVAQLTEPNRPGLLLNRASERLETHAVGSPAMTAGDQSAGTTGRDSSGRRRRR